MKKLLLTLTICLLSLSNNAQEQITTQLEKAYQERKYDLIISDHSSKCSEYPAKAIYFVAMAYYMKANDNKVLELMDLSIEKDKTDPDAYFIKGMTYNYIGQFDKAIESFKKAIELDSSNTNYFSGLGDSYFNQQKYEKSLVAYTTATKKNEPVDRPFTMIPQIYADRGDSENALKAFYNAKNNIEKDTESYIIVLYNIGLYELLNKNYDKAENALKELILLAPNDFHSYAKLIQVYYGRKEYEKAKPLREKLYKAYESGQLKDNLAEMFCFDQFNWQDKLIQVYERFAIKEGELYYKHLFYVTNKKGEIEFRIQTENSPISVELGGPKYVLGMDKNGTHSTFRYGFEEDFDYEDLKRTVILVLEDKIKPGASSRRKN